MAEWLDKVAPKHEPVDISAEMAKASEPVGRIFTSNRHVVTKIAKSESVPRED